MTIDYPAQSQYPELRQLWQQAFGDTEAFLDGFFATGFSPKRCRCISWNDRCAAALYWFDCRWGEKKLAYVYAVATQEDFRGKGFCRMLMEDTHKLLQAQGYHGAILVPGSRQLFDLYEKLGYRGCCPMEQQAIVAQDAPVAVRALTAEEFAQLRRQRLPENAVVQEGDSLSYLATFAGFYEAQESVFCASLDGDNLLFQEFLGQENMLPGILTALGAKQGVTRRPGGTQNRAMYYPLTEDETLPGYFGLPLN